MLKVLIVEDEELIRKGIALTVDWATLDCVVVGEAANGAEGLEKAEKCDPDLIITDLKMPQMDGIEMLERLRQAGKTTHVIILTAYDSFSYVQTALRLEAVDYLLKPFHDGDLEKAVQSGDLSAFLSKLSPAQSARLQAVLSDKAATERLLSTPQAKALLQRRARCADTHCLLLQPAADLDRSVVAQKAADLACDLRHGIG